MTLDDKLLEKARQEFIQRTGGKPYTPPIPVDQAPPLPETTQPK